MYQIVDETITAIHIETVSLNKRRVLHSKSPFNKYRTQLMVMLHRASAHTDQFKSNIQADIITYFNRLIDILSNMLPTPSYTIANVDAL